MTEGLIYSIKIRMNIQVIFCGTKHQKSGKYWATGLGVNNRNDSKNVII